MRRATFGATMTRLPSSSPLHCPTAAAPSLVQAPRFRVTKQSLFTPAEDVLLALGISRCRDPRRAGARCMVETEPGGCQALGSRIPLDTAAAAGPHLPTGTALTGTELRQSSCPTSLPWPFFTARKTCAPARRRPTLCECVMAGGDGARAAEAPQRSTVTIRCRRKPRRCAMLPPSPFRPGIQPRSSPPPTPGRMPRRR